MNIGDPKRISELRLLGHMLNNGCGNPFQGKKFEDLKNTSTFRNSYAQYILQSGTSNNCRFCYHQIWPFPG